MMVSVPPTAPTTPPETGASTKRRPAATTPAAMPSTAAGGQVAISTTSHSRGASRAPSWNRTASACAAFTQHVSIARPAASAAEDAAIPGFDNIQGGRPISKPRTRKPRATRFFAMGSPSDPRPMKPTVGHGGPHEVQALLIIEPRRNARAARQPRSRCATDTTPTLLCSSPWRLPRCRSGRAASAGRRRRETHPARRSAGTAEPPRAQQETGDRLAQPADDRMVLGHDHQSAVARRFFEDHLLVERLDRRRMQDCDIDAVGVQRIRRFQRASS